MLRLNLLWQQRGPLACLLLPLALLHRAALTLRRAAYRRGLKRSERLPVPVVVVGNLVAGGAGKTPTVLAVVDLLRRLGYTPGIVSRGYGRADDRQILAVTRHSPAAQVGDEPLLLHLRSAAPVVVGRARPAAGRALLAAHPEVDVIVADDGLQHLALARDAAVIVFDERGAGNGWLLPAGPLREPLPCAVPPASTVLYNAARPSTPLPGALAERRLAGAASLEDWWRGATPRLDCLQALRGRPVTAAAGMAAPGRYFAMLRDEGLTLRELALPDHHDYATLPWPPETGDVVVTEKDAVKLVPALLPAGGPRVWVVRLDFRPAPAFDAAVAALLAAHPPRHRYPPTDDRHGLTTA